MRFNPIIYTGLQDDDLRDVLQRLGTEAHGVEILVPKSTLWAVKLHGVRSPAANILKQEMLALGGDVAVANGVVNCTIERSDLLILGTKQHYRSLLRRIGEQEGFELAELARQLADALNGYAAELAAFHCGRYTLSLNLRTHIMGVLNVTPDSFYSGKRYPEAQAAVDAGLRMADEGADIIDVGGESTRPGAGSLDAEEELRRVLPVVKRLVNETNVPISVDTYKAEVATQVLDAGVDLINDISGLSFDHRLAAVAARYKAPIVISHTKGLPKTMQDDPRYADLVGEIVMALRDGCHQAASQGVPAEQMIVDPGIGFGKTTDHNLRLIKNLSSLRVLGKPILIGVSRKSFLGEVLQVLAEERLHGAMAAVALCVQNGANIVRVHDVKETTHVVRVADAVRRGRNTVTQE